MSRNTFAVLLSLAALAVVLGIVYLVTQQVAQRAAESPPASTASAKRVVDVFRAAAAQQRASDAARRQDCIREVLGAERYAAIVLSPWSARTEDRLRILPCYEP